MIRKWLPIGIFKLNRINWTLFYQSILNLDKKSPQGMQTLPQWSLEHKIKCKKCHHAWKQIKLLGYHWFIFVWVQWQWMIQGPEIKMLKVLDIPFTMPRSTKVELRVMPQSHRISKPSILRTPTYMHRWKLVAFIIIPHIYWNHNPWPAFKLITITHLPKNMFVKWRQKQQLQLESHRIGKTKISSWPCKYVCFIQETHFPHLSSFFLENTHIIWTRPSNPSSWSPKENKHQTRTFCRVRS